MAKKQKRPHIVRVESNLKSPTGVPWSLDIGQRTLIYGGNARHKSAVLQAVELALTGAVDDLIGRSAVKDAAMLLTMVPGDSISCQVEFDTDDQASFLLEKGSRPQCTKADDNVLPLRQVRSALAGSPATLRKALLKWSAPSLTRHDVLGQIPQQYHPKFDDLAEHIGKNRGETDTLVAILEYVDKRARGASKELKGAKSIVEELEQLIEVVPSQDDIADAQAAVANLGAMPAIDVDIADVALAIEDAEDAVAHWVQHLQTVGHRPATDFDVAAELVLQHVIDEGIGQCPVCSSHVGLDHLGVCRQHYSRRTSEAVQQREAYDAAQKSLQTWVSEVDKLRRHRDTMENIEVYQSAMAHLEKLQIARGQWEGLSSARRQCEALEQDLDAYKALKLACDNAIVKILGQHSTRFCSRVNAYMPKGWQFHLEMSSKTPRIGLGTEDFRAALSGAEWTTVTTAIAAVVSESLPGDTPAVLIPEDRAFDPSTLGRVMRGYKKFPGQVIMASTVKPRGRRPSDWTFIDLDEANLCWPSGPFPDPGPTCVGSVPAST